MNDMLGGVHYLPNGVKICHPHSDFAGFCDPTSRLPGYLPPCNMCTHVRVGGKFEYSYILVLMSDVLTFYDKMAYWKIIVAVTYTGRTFLTALFDPCFTCVKNQ